MFNKNTFKKPQKAELKKILTPLQYSVTQENATERPFTDIQSTSEFFNTKEAGIYVDIVSGEPLFTSKDKYDSGCGWPSFTAPIEDSEIVEKSDLTYNMQRIEVRSKYADSHLGHVFNDGPQIGSKIVNNPTGLRYCINSSALRFIKKADLEKEGYEEYLKLFN